MQIDYTSRDFESLKADLVALISARTNTEWDPTDYSDLGHVIVESFAYMGDVMSHYLDRIASEVSIDTAIQKNTLLSLANLYGYKPSGPTPAEILVSFTNISDQIVDIPAGTQVMAPLSYGPFFQAYFETTTSATAIEPDATITLTAVEGKTVNTDRPDLIDTTYNKPLPANLGTSNGSANQSFNIVDPGVIDSSIVVYVGQGSSFGSWSYVDSLLEKGPTEPVFTTRRNDDDTVTILFGDGINGAIPSSGQLISSTYRVSVGVAGNIKSLSIAELTFIPGNIDPQAVTFFTVSNPLPATGGANSDGTDQLKEKIKAAVVSRKRAVTLDDYAKLALLVQQVGKANASSSVYSSVNLYIQPQNDNSAVPGFKESTIVSVSGTGTQVTYTTTSAHGLAVGDTVNITGIEPIAYNQNGAYVTAVSTSVPHSFTVSNSTTAALTRGGLVVGTTPTNIWNAISTAVSDYLSDKVLAGTSLNIFPPAYVPIYLKAALSVGGAYRQADIKLAVYKAMLGSGGLFQYANNKFGAKIPLSSVTSALQGIAGVESVTITQLCTDGSATAASITLSASQIPYLTASNLVTTVTGGIA